MFLVFEFGSMIHAIITIINVVFGVDREQGNE
jgi:hypothetical protein